MARPRQPLVPLGLAEKLGSLFPSIACSRGTADGLARREGGPGTLCHPRDCSLVLQTVCEVPVAVGSD